MGSLSSRQRDTKSGASVNNQGSSEETNGLKTKLTKDSRSAFYVRDTGALSPYTLNKGYSLDFHMNSDDNISQFLAVSLKGFRDPNYTKEPI